MNWIVRDAVPGQEPAPLVQRYPEEAIGYDVWRQAPLDRPDAPGAWTSWLTALQGQWSRRAGPPVVPPCVFVSHKQQDFRRGLRAAYLAAFEGYDYWIDVLDPQLQALTGAAGHLPPEVLAILMAGCIEMGLLNSTHVLAIVTAMGLESRWIPYEFGRAKAPMVFSLQAAAYAYGVTSADLSRVEFIYLCPVLQADATKTGDDKVSEWLDAPAAPPTGPPGLRRPRGVAPPRPARLDPSEAWPPAELP